MAKVKKEKLSLEEMLEEAIVKEEDRPHEVPGNWVWTTLDKVAEYKKGPFGSAITKAMFVPRGSKTYKVYEQGNAIRKDKNYGSYYISEEKYKELKGFTVCPRDLIVSCAGTVGEIYQLPEGIEEGIINQALMRIKVNEKLNLKFYLWYFDESLKSDITGKSKGTAIKNIPPFAVLKAMPFPLPPLAEQQRIVEVIESLFEKLDTAKELVQNALDSFETRKAAILHKAFTGELTAKWREENGVRLESWEFKPLKNICSKITDGEHFRPPVVEEGIPFLSAKDVREDGVSFDNILYISIETAEKALKRCNPEQNDILIVSRGATVGRMCIVNTDTTFCLLGSVILLKTKDVLSKLICYFLKSPEINQRIIQASGATAQQAIYLRDIKEIKLPIPSLIEQKEIVRILDNILEKEQRAKELSDVIEKIDLMKKAILARAFRGELRTNNPEEESAVELLKEVLIERI